MRLDNDRFKRTVDRMLRVWYAGFIVLFVIMGYKTYAQMPLSFLEEHTVVVFSK